MSARRAQARLRKGRVRGVSRQRAQRTATPVPQQSTHARHIAIVAACAVIGIGIVAFKHLSERSGRDAVASIEPVVASGYSDLSQSLREHLDRYIERVRRTPGHAERHADLGVAYEANRLWSAARDCYKNALALGSKDPLTMYHLGMVHQSLGDVDKAIQWYTETNRQRSDFAPAFHRLGDLQLELGNTSDAEAAMRTALALSPDSPATQGGVASVLIRQHDYESAVQVLEKCVGDFPGNGNAHHMLGLAYRALGRDAEADRAFKAGAGSRKVFMPDPWLRSFARHTPEVSLTAHVEAALRLLSAGDGEQAAERLRYAIEWYPDSAELRSKLGSIYLMLGKPSDACACLLRAEILDNMDAMVLANLAVCHLRTSRPEEAVVFADRAIAVAPSQPAPYLTKGRALVSLGRPEAAVAIFSHAWSLDPSRTVVGLELGRALMHLNRHEEAIRRMDQVVAADPSSLEAYLMLCQASMERGDIDQAHRYLDAASRISPGHGEVLKTSRKLAQLSR